MPTKDELKNKNDLELYNDFLLGNNEAFNILVKKYIKTLVYFIQKYVKRIDIAENLAQDTFVYILVNKKEYKYNFSIKTFLFIVAKSRALNYLRKEKKNIIISEEYDSNIEDTFNIEENILSIEKCKKVRLALSKLKKEYQIIIYLKYFQNFQYKEICKILNITMPKTKMLLHRARKSLKKILEEDKNYDE